MPELSRGVPRRDARDAGDHRAAVGLRDARGRQSPTRAARRRPTRDPGDLGAPRSGDVRLRDDARRYGCQPEAFDDA